MRPYKKGYKFRPIVEVLKTRGRVPTILMIDGRRYVYTPTAQSKLERKQTHGSRHV